MEKLLELLNGLEPDVDFSKEEHLIDDHLIDSLQIIELVSDIEDEFDVEIPLAQVVPENFQSAGAIWALIERMEDEN